MTNFATSQTIRSPSQPDFKISYTYLLAWNSTSYQQHYMLQIAIAIDSIFVEYTDLFHSIVGTPPPISSQNSYSTTIGLYAIIIQYR